MTASAVSVAEGYIQLVASAQASTNQRVSKQPSLYRMGLFTPLGIVTHLFNLPIWRFQQPQAPQELELYIFGALIHWKMSYTGVVTDVSGACGQHRFVRLQDGILPHFLYLFHSLTPIFILIQFEHVMSAKYSQEFHVSVLFFYSIWSTFKVQFSSSGSIEGLKNRFCLQNLKSVKHLLWFGP